MEYAGIIARMTLAQKCAILSGADVWYTRAFEKLGIPAIALSDGPSGLRKQAGEGVSACAKHFAVNSQEDHRMASDSVLDERTLRELYLTNFEIAVREGRPGAVMNS